MAKLELVDITAEIKAETEKGLLLFDGKREAWVAKSQVQENEDGSFTMPVWLATKIEFV
jgi:hypothetical protein